MLNPRRLPRQASRYLWGFIWLVRESLRVASAEWQRVVVATFFFLAGNSAVLGAIFLYVRLLERNQPIPLLQVTLRPRESVLLLGVFIGTVLLGLSTIAVSQYVARTAALGIHRRYQQNSTLTALRLAQCLPDACAPKAAALTRTTGLRPYYMDYPRSCGWTMRFIANAFPALTLFSVAFTLLLWLDPWITLLVFLLGLLLVAAQYPSSLLAAHASNVVDKTRVDFVQRLRELAARIDQSALRSVEHPSISTDIDRLYDDPSSRRHLDAQYNRYWALELSALTMQTGGAVVLAFILFVVVRDLLVKGGDWATLAVYAALLRQLLGTATDVFRAVTVFSRFSPHINAFRSLVESVEHRGKCEPPSLPKKMALHARPLQANSEFAYLHRGETFLVLTRGKLGRSLALDLQAALVEANPSGIGKPGAPPSFPSIGFLGAGTDAAATSDTLCRTLAEHPGIILASLKTLGQLDVTERERIAQFVSDAALGLVGAQPPERVAANTLLLVRDADARWYWMRAGAEGLSALEKRKILQRLNHPSGALRRAPPAVDTDID
jgi:hypothetical protein